MQKKQHSKKEELAMSNKKFNKVLALSLLATLGLVGCSSDIHAKPSDYDDNILSYPDNSEDIYHNMVSIVEDAYRDGSLASHVLDEVLYQYSVSVFGRYNRISKPYNLGENEITLKEAYVDIKVNNTNPTVARRFIDEHKAYWTTNNEGERLTTDEAKASELARVKAKWQTIEDRISIELYNTITAGSYSTRGNFSEKRYLIELRSNMSKVKNPYLNTTVTYEEEDKLVFTPDVKDTEVFTGEWVDGSGNTQHGYLHRENYQDPRAFDLNAATETKDAEVKYIEEEIIPTIYRSLLVEQYLLDESYNTLGRSYARKVNVLAIKTNANNDKAANYLMKYFVRNVISGSKNDTGVTLEDMKDASDAMKGVSALDRTYLGNVNAVYPGAFTFVNTGTANEYAIGTDYGDMMKDYEKITTDINTTDSAVESDFTGSYTYPIEVGKQIKENDIKAKDYTTDGWYIKNGGLTTLPDTIRTRLFNIGVANVLDSASVVDRFATATYTVPENESNLVAKINGKYYLKVASKQSDAPSTDDILFYDNSSSTYYVVQIEEAISASKLAKEAENPVYSTDAKEEIINEVAKVIASDDTYRTLSTKHWLEQACIKYHDTVVYEYFKTNYPELFED